MKLHGLRGSEAPEGGPVGQVLHARFLTLIIIIIFAENLINNHNIIINASTSNDNSQRANDNDLIVFDDISSLLT